MSTKFTACTVALALLAGCGPRKTCQNVANWPDPWAGRKLWTTPHAYLYATHAADAGELDRLTEQIRQRYVADVHGPTRRPLIVVRDVHEPLPVRDTDALLRHAMRFTVQRDLDESATPEAFEAAVDSAVIGVKMGAVACGTDTQVAVAMAPLICDPTCLRELCDVPEKMIADVDLAIIIPTSACLRHNTGRLVHDALKMYGIGPVAQVLLAPVVALAKSKVVRQMSALREAALYNYWLFENPDLTETEKRKLAAAYLERWVGDVEASAAGVAEVAIDTVGTVDGSQSE